MGSRWLILHMLAYIRKIGLSNTRAYLVFLYWGLAHKSCCLFSEYLLYLAPACDIKTLLQWTCGSIWYRFYILLNVVHLTKQRISLNRMILLTGPRDTFSGCSSLTFSRRRATVSLHPTFPAAVATVSFKTECPLGRATIFHSFGCVNSSENVFAEKQ